MNNNALSIDYSDELFSESFVTGFGKKFKKILQEVLEDRSKTIDQLVQTEKAGQALDLSFNFDL